MIGILAWMCMLCAAAKNPRPAALGALAAVYFIDMRMLCWLAMFALSMSYMDHNRAAAAVDATAEDRRPAAD